MYQMIVILIFIVFLHEIILCESVVDTSLFSGVVGVGQMTTFNLETNNAAVGINNLRSFNSQGPGPGTVIGAITGWSLNSDQITFDSYFIYKWYAVLTG